MDNDKRRRHRIIYEKRILCRNLTTHIADMEIHQEDPFLINIEDISYLGLRIVSERFLKKGDQLVFNIKNNRRIMEVVAEVKWSKYQNEKYEAGLEILNITRELLLFLNEIIRNPSSD